MKNERKKSSGGKRLGLFQIQFVNLGGILPKVLFAGFLTLSGEVGIYQDDKALVIPGFLVQGQLLP